MPKLLFLTSLDESNKLDTTKVKNKKKKKKKKKAIVEEILRPLSEVMQWGSEMNQEQDSTGFNDRSYTYFY